MSRFYILLLSPFLFSCAAVKEIVAAGGEMLTTLTSGAGQEVVEAVRDGLIGYGTTGDVAVGATALATVVGLYQKLKNSEKGEVLAS